MNRGLLDLILLSVRGRIVRRARLLRQPRYLIAFLAGLAYLALVLAPRLFAGAGARRSFPVAGEYEDVLHLGFGLVLTLAVTMAWLLASSRPALRLNETEIDFLLPAPISHRQIILYSLLRQQPGILMSVVVIYLVRGASRAGVGALAGAFGLWALFTLIDLHLKGISLWKARLKELPPHSAWLRRAAAVALAAAWWLPVLAGLRAAWQTAVPSLVREDPGAFVRALGRAVESDLAGTLLAPFAWLTRGASSSTGFGRLLAVLAVLAIIVLHTVWVVGSRASFEEATLERARRESARKGLSRQELRARSRRAGNPHREPFRLAPAGRPETVILWKNLMLRGRTPLGWLGAFLAATLVLGTAADAVFGSVVSAVFLVTGLSLMIGIPLLAGMILRNDLRNDLLYVEVLRTWPLAGRRLVLAEILAPAVNVFFILLTGCVLLTAAVAGDALSREADRIRMIPRAIFGGVPPLLALPVVLASALVAGMSVTLLSLALQNLAVLVLPSWIGLGGLSSRRGTAVLGQRMLVMIGYLLAMTVAALPTLLVLAAAVALHIFLEAPFHLWELPLFALVATVLLGSKVLLIARVAGMVWDRLDPSKEILTLAEND
ncbi:MAG TPA: putative ABC exporter domain-containing protein [Thermoanaerobaculia bacterium]|nr:putative ABC exporter domain-containing protein [Thermoanaerobaculia bacterium]